MPLRCRQSFTLFPGVRLNISKSGISTTIGVPGASVNLSSRGARATVGIPLVGPVLLGQPVPGDAAEPSRADSYTVIWLAAGLLGPASRAPVGLPTTRGDATDQQRFR